MSSLLPPGIDTLADCPFPLHYAILTAFHILSFEEWPLSDRPPKRIWLDNDKLREHFDQVEARMKQRMEHGDEEEEAGEMEFNALELVTRG